MKGKQSWIPLCQHKGKIVFKYCEIYMHVQFIYMCLYVFAPTQGIWLNNFQIYMFPCSQSSIFFRLRNSLIRSDYLSIPLFPTIILSFLFLSFPFHSSPSYSFPFLPPESSLVLHFIFDDFIVSRSIADSLKFPLSL